MKKIKRYFYVFALLFLSARAVAQVSGVQTVPGTYATLAALVTDLNTVGVGPGGATINVAAGYTEALSAPLVLTITTNTTTSSRPLVIQKSGAGANPMLTAFTGTGALDGMVVLNGVDYVTIDGIDLQENAANVTATTQMEWGYALLKTSATNGTQRNTIKNVLVTLNKVNTSSVAIYLGNHTTASVTALTVSNLTGTSSYNNFYNNTLQNCYGGYSITGYASPAPYDFYDQNNQIGRDGVSTNPSRITNFGGGAATVNAINATNQNGIKVFGTNINGGTSSTGAVNGISLVAGVNSNVDIYNDTITLSSSSVGGSNLFGINNAMGGTGAGNTVNIYNNVVDGCTYATNTSGIFRGIVSSSTASYTNMYGNKVTNNNIPGTGEFSCIHYSGSSVNIVLNVNLNDNLISGNTKTGTAGAFYALFGSASCVAMNAFNNQMTNNSASATSAGVYGYYNFAFALNENVYNNTVSNLVGGSGDISALHVRSGSAPTNKEIYGNTIHTISGNTANTFAAIWSDYGTVSNIYKNTVYNLTNNSTTGAGVGGIIGIYVGSNTNTLTNVFNNYVSDLKAPNMSSVTALVGIFILSPANSTTNAYYNTVYLNASSTGVNFGTLAMNCAANPISIDLRNNILVNVSTPAGTGLTRALGRSSAALTNYALTSGYNCLYAGTPSASNLLFWDGVNSCQTIKAFKDLVGPREQASFTTLPPFVNTAVAPYDLHLQTAIATQCEGGGTNVAGYTVDFDGNTRNVSTPDVGADEITGITTDIASPNILYTPLTNSSVAATRVLTNFATVTDPSGVNTTIGTKPRLYYKLSTNANTYNSNINATDGWKYVEASNAASPFNFTIDYSLLFGGAGVAAGNIVQYFVVAQDLNGTPIVGINSGGFATLPASVNLAAANFPLANNINQYTIVSAALSGTVNVGPAELITSLTNAGGAFQAINASTLSGNLVLNITGDLTTETGTFALNQWAEEGTGNYTITISPSAAAVRTISGSSAAASLVRFDGADRVTIDGRFGGSGQYLRFRNTSNAAPAIGFINDAQNNTVNYTIVESGNTSTSTTLGGAILIGATTGLNGNDNITVSNCELRDRSDVAGTSAMLINCVGTNTSLGQYNDNCVIDNNNFHDWFLLNSNSQFALNIATGNSGFTVTNNSFYQTATRTNTAIGAITRAINISFTSTVPSNGGFNVSNNFIGGSAPGATGSDMTLTVSGASITQTFGGINMTTGMIPNSVQNNVIRKIDFSTCAPTSNSTMWFGISANQGVYNIGTIAGNTIGDGASTGSLKINILTGGTSSSFFAGILGAAVNGYMNIRNNTIAGITIGGTNTAGAIIPQWIQVQGTPSATTSVIGNTIGSATTANSIQNTLTTASAISFDIRFLVSSGAGLNFSNNTIANITDLSTNATSAHYGALFISTVGGSGTITASNNSIHHLSSAAGSATPALTMLGLSVQGFGGLNHSFTGNSIYDLSSTNTGAFSNYVVGIQTQGNSMGGTLANNRIYNLSNVNTGTGPGIAGVYFSAGINWSVNNNMISVNNGANTNAVTLFGIADFTSGSMAYNYNSIYIGGTASGTVNTYSLIRGSGAAISLRNNLLYNQRAGGTGVHYAIANTNTTPSFNWGPSASNYNAFIVADTSKIGEWGTGISVNLATWRTNSGTDANSIREINTTITNAALFVNAAAGDLHINTSTYPEALGTPVVGITTDYDGNARSATTPTIGADELACSPIAFAVGSQVNVTCNGGNTGSVTLTGTGGNGLTYAWSPSGGTAATASGLSAGAYTCNITNICGNTGSVPVTITQPAAITSAQSPVVCSGGSVTVGGNTYTTNGTYIDVLTAANGCDSTVTTNLTVSPAITNSQTLTVCAGGSVTVGGNTYTTSGTYVDVLGAVNGCDSTVTTNLTVSPAISSTQTLSVCAGGSVTVGGNTYTTSGTYVDVLGAVNGCDSTVTTNLTVNPAITSSQTLSVCAGGSVTVGGNTYTTSGTYIDVLAAANGCDSTVTTNLTVSAAIASSQTVTVCAGGSVTVGGNTYTSSGTYVDVLTAIGGCDSTVTTNLTVLGAIDVTTSLAGVTISANQNGATYQWIDCGNANAPIAGATNQSYTPTVNGSYAVIVTVSGCSDTTACVAITTIGLAETTFGDGLSVYPNPSNGVFTIELTDASANVVITNAIGEFVTQMTVVNGLNTLDLQHEADGVYFINVTSENKQQVIKIVKQL